LDSDIPVDPDIPVDLDIPFSIAVFIIFPIFSKGISLIIFILFVTCLSPFSPKTAPKSSTSAILFQGTQS
jgi:hypothetical protein